MPHDNIFCTKSPQLRLFVVTLYRQSNELNEETEFISFFRQYKGERQNSVLQDADEGWR